MQNHAAIMTSAAAPSATDRSQRLTAIGLMALATLVLRRARCQPQISGRQRSGVPVAQVTWLRFVGHVVFSAVVLWPFAFTPSLRSAKP